MSPDKPNLTRADAIRRRKEEEQKRREMQTQKSVFGGKIAPANRSEPQEEKSMPTTFRGITTSPSKRLQQRMEFSQMAPTENTRKWGGVKLPAFHFSLPRLDFGARMYSLMLVLFCFFDLYVMQTNSFFMANNFQINGNIYVKSEDIQTAAKTSNVASASVNPEEIRSRLLASFPDITEANIEVKLPNKIIITIMERSPLAAWQQDGQVVWVDMQGYAFPPREQDVNIPLISATGAPPVVQTEPNQPENAKPFLPAELASSIAFIIKNLPEGATMIYEPEYGLGWSDPRGFKVFLGNNAKNNPLKLQVYQAMLGYLSQKNIQPTMISVEYPNAPYFRTEQ